jgi:hypothetical protein
MFEILRLYDVKIRKTNIEFYLSEFFLLKRIFEVILGENYFRHRFHFTDRNLM